MYFHDYELEDYLEHSHSSFSLPFNTLPPGNYAQIPSLGISVPIVEAPYISEERLVAADFKQELTQGIVHYPRTLIPGDTHGSSLFF